MSHLTRDEEIELIRVTSKMPVTSGLDKALSILIEPLDNNYNKNNYYLDTEYPKDFDKWGKKIQDNWKQAVRNESKKK